MFTKLRLKYIRQREIRLRLELNSGKYIPKPRFKRIHKKLRKLSRVRDRLKAIREYNEQHMSEVTNKELLEAIKELGVSVQSTKEQVVRNAEAMASLEQVVLKIPEEVSVRNSYQFRDHDDRIERIEKHLDLV